MWGGLAEDAEALREGHGAEEGRVAERALEHDLAGNPEAARLGHRKTNIHGFHTLWGLRRHVHEHRETFFFLFFSFFSFFFFLSVILVSLPHSDGRLLSVTNITLC